MRRICTRVTLTAVVMLAFVISGPYAQAHNRSQSFSSWHITDAGVEVLFTVKSREATRLPAIEGNFLSLDSLLIAHLQHTVSVKTENGSCPPQGKPTSLPAEPGYLRARWLFKCPHANSTTVHLDSFFSVARSHVHFARIAIDDGLPAEFLFTENVREQTVKLQGGSLNSFYRAFVQYLLLGVEHIAGGVDHIAFLIVLLLLIRRLRDVVWVVSGFTIGHSITLSLAALGLVVPNVSVVEAVIGFTIAVVALENIGVVSGTNRQLGFGVSLLLVIMALVSMTLGRGLPMTATVGLLIFTLAYLAQTYDRSFALKVRPMLTLMFGMIHGFGFAGVLTEIGLPQGRLVAALAGFNIGVELGQVLIVSAVWFCARWVYRSGLIRDKRAWLDTTSAALCGLGCYWFVARSFTQV